MEVDARPIEVVIAEFSALRDEIGYRSTTQHLLMNLNIVATGAVVGFAIPNPDNLLLLLLTPVVSSALGLLWADHARSVFMLAGYIDTYLTYERDGREMKLFPWEERSREREGNRPLFVKFRIAVVLVFVVPSLLALLYLVVEVRAAVHSGIVATAWYTGLLLTIYMTVVILRVKFKPEDTAPVDSDGTRTQV